MIKRNIRILSFFCVQFLVACSSKNDSPPNHSTIITADKPPTISQETSGRVVKEGPSDSGGGDTCNQKVIDASSIDIRQEKEFIEFIKPILDQIDSSSESKKSTTSSTESILSAALFKTWYFITCPLNKIPNENKGIVFETDQAAIQKGNEIFIDLIQYNKMTSENKAWLLLHEIVMASYLLKYMTMFEMIKLQNIKISENNREMFNKIMKMKKFIPQPYRPLNEKDYQNIRTVTSWIIQNKDKITKKELYDKMRTNDFDERILRSYPETEETKTVEIKLDQIIKMIKRASWGQLFPAYCQFVGDDLKSQSKCKTTATAEIIEEIYYSKLVLNLTIQRLSDSKIFTNTFSYPFSKSKENEEPKINLSYTPGSFFGKVSPWMLSSNSLSTSEKSNLKEGSQITSLILWIDYSDEKNLQLNMLQYQPHTVYLVEEKIEDIGGYKYKSRYAHLTPMEKEGETLFIEPDLMFLWPSFFEGPMLIENTMIENKVLSPTPPSAQSAPAMPAAAAPAATATGATL